MKKLVLLTICQGALLLLAAAQQPVEGTFRLDGDVSALKSPAVIKVYLAYASGDDQKQDSVEVKEGKYHFSGRVEEPVPARLIAVYSEKGGLPVDYDRDMARVFLQPGHVMVSHLDSFSNITVKGSPAHTAYEELDRLLRPYSDREKELSKQYAALYRAGDKPGMEKMEPLFDSAEAAIKNVYKDYVLQDPKSPVALFALNAFAGWKIDVDQVEPLFQSLPLAQRNLPSGKKLADRIGIAKKTAIGRYAMNFTQADTAGRPVTLASFKGKYLLLDFWASWCGPCRAENPNLVKVYHQYHDKGFNILSVSLDRPGDKDKWMAAIHKDGLTWTHVSDLQFWDNAVAKMYGIRGIPQNLLLDPSGRIIAQNLRGDALEKKLEELFDPKS